MSLTTFCDCLHQFNANRALYGNKTMCCRDGVITFYHSTHIHEVLIYHVNVTKKRTGIFTSFLDALVNDDSVRTIGVLAVSSMDMLHCLNKYGGFNDVGGDFMMYKK